MSGNSWWPPQFIFMGFLISQGSLLQDDLHQCASTSRFTFCTWHCHCIYTHMHTHTHTHVHARTLSLSLSEIQNLQLLSDTFVSVTLPT
jgi:hypothetical protein